MGSMFMNRIRVLPTDWGIYFQYSLILLVIFQGSEIVELGFCVHECCGSFLHQATRSSSIKNSSNTSGLGCHIFYVWICNIYRLRFIELHITFLSILQGAFKALLLSIKSRYSADRIAKCKTWYRRWSCEFIEFKISSFFQTLVASITS